MGGVDDDWSRFASRVLHLQEVMLIFTQSSGREEVCSLVDDLRDVVLAYSQALVHQRLVVNDPSRLFPCVGADDQLRIAVLDAVCQLVRREPAEYDHVSRSDSSAGVDGDQTFNGHRHVDDHPIPRLNSEFLPQSSCEVLNSFVKLDIGDLAPLNIGNVTCSVMGLS